MRTEPITIDGVAGPVVVTTGRFGGAARVEVNGEVVPQLGDRHHRLPATGGGTVEAVVRGGTFDPYPTVEVGGVKHRTGPKVNGVVQALAFAPMIMAITSGLVGGLVGLAGVLANATLLRSRLRPGAKVLAVIGVDLAVIVVAVALAMAVRHAID
ncbi:hypothetical protein OWR29_03995 [Actinoplanes sp. Pm04-4]|uniref:Uncharacterized protein n=1 Tax=Paractinoplanes pyxinae TaxID=2997416 RepID=A0ABT4ASD2_9ACTN|nr:hypothetical protein [Actinoplanes pyxinae]MCY1137148.1 hypothetical protein [Actinoplanes pyxinae]